MLRIMLAAVVATFAVPAYAFDDPNDRPHQKWFDAKMARVNLKDNTIKVIEGKFSGSGSSGDSKTDKSNNSNPTELICKFDSKKTYCHKKGSTERLTMGDLDTISSQAIEIPIRIYYPDTQPLSAKEPINATELIIDMNQPTAKKK